MKCLRVLLFFFFSTAAWAQNHPVPFLNQPLAPSSASPGGASFTLTAHGSGFVSGATINWNGTPLTTTFVSVDELTATVPASDIANPSTASVTVTNPAPGGGTSNVGYFAVSLPANRQFATSPSTQALPLIRQITAADFIRNGKLDVAILTIPVPESGASQFNGVMALGNGDGTFQSPIQSFSPRGGWALELAVGDLNGDGIPDLALVGAIDDSPGDSFVSTFIGNGDGTFSSNPLTGGEENTFGALALLGDYNSDGKLDLAVGSSGGETIAAGIVVFPGNGDGTLGGPVVSSISNMGNIAAVGDFDGDGKLDLIVITGYSTTPELDFCHGNGDGTFASPTLIGPNVGTFTIAADLNGDGTLDLITVQSSSFTVMLGNGNGTFQTAQVYQAGSSISDAVLGNFGANGKLDLALANNGTNTLIVPGNGDGTFNVAGIVTLAFPSIYLLGGDFNNDGKLDLALATGTEINGPQSLVYLLQDAPIAGLSPSAVTFNPQPVGTTSSQQSVTLTNNGTSALSLSNVAITGSNSGDFSQTNNCPASIAAAGSCQINVTFTPTATGPRSASLVLTDDAPASPQTVALSGSGGLAAVRLSPSSLSFGNESVGLATAPQTITLSNTGYSTLNISSIGVTGTNTGDFSESVTCGSTLAAGANCTISVTFGPTALGARTATLTIIDDGPGSPQNAAVTGTGVGPVVLSPASISFQSQYVGTTGLPQSVTVTNNGSSPLTISAITTSPSDFGSLNACGSTVAPGASCAIGIFFEPTTAGTRTGTLTITDSAIGSPQTVPLKGVGQDFSVAASSSSSATVTSGQTASYSVAIAPGGGFNQNVALSCSGAPASSVCSLSSSSVALNGSSPTSVRVSVSTGVASANPIALIKLPPAHARVRLFFSIAVLVMFAMLYFALLPFRRRQVWLLRGIALASLLLFVMTFSSCGGGGGGSHGGGGTPAGTYTLTVTGTFNSGSTTLSHATNLTLVVH
jgi:hypothetical protein